MILKTCQIFTGKSVAQPNGLYSSISGFPSNLYRQKVSRNLTDFSEYYSPLTNNRAGKHFIKLNIYIYTVKPIYGSRSDCSTLRRRLENNQNCKFYSQAMVFCFQPTNRSSCRSSNSISNSNFTNHVKPPLLT